MQEDVDDATLVGRARDGDVRAYDALVHRYQGPMFRLALRMLGNRADAEDVVQDAFVTVWRKLGQLRQDGAFVGWLYRTTANRCLNLLRTRRPRAEVEWEELPSHATVADPARSAEVGAGLAALDRALQELTPQQRACWLLREVHGRSYEEIAESVGAGPTAVRGRIARARAQLAEVMRPWQ